MLAEEAHHIPRAQGRECAKYQAGALQPEHIQRPRKGRSNSFQPGPDLISKAAPDVTGKHARHRIIVQKHRLLALGCCLLERQDSPQRRGNAEKYVIWKAKTRGKTKRKGFYRKGREGREGGEKDQTPGRRGASKLIESEREIQVNPRLKTLMKELGDAINGSL